LLQDRDDPWTAAVIGLNVAPKSEGDR